MKLRFWMTAVLLLVIGSQAAARLVTLDFENLAPTGTGQSSNVVIDGFRFSPNCHYDAVPASNSPNAFVNGYQNTGWIGTDSSGCYTSINPEFLGPAEYAPTPGQLPSAAVLWIDYFGQTFSLESVFLNFSGLQIATSRGGLYTAPLPNPPAGYPVVTFNSPLFDEVQWVMLIVRNSGAPLGLDHMTFQVADAMQIPEPASGALAGVALAMLMVARRRKTPESVLASNALTVGH